MPSGLGTPKPPWTDSRCGSRWSASILAGSTLDVPIEAGQAARIMTGAPLPTGADAVCMLEECHDGGRTARSVVIGHPVTAGHGGAPDG